MARKLASIKSLYKFMLNNKVINVNHAKIIKAPKINKTLPHFLSLKEAEEILIRSREKAGGIQFISVQSTPEEQIFKGFWMLKDMPGY